jgi:hypothetical protein
MTETNDKTFTTAPKNRKRKGNPSPVRERCIQFIHILREMGYDKMISLEEAFEIFQSEMGIMDAKSLRAYFGTRAGRAERTIDEMKSYQNGERKFRSIQLSYKIAERRGYLEIFGLVEFEKKGKCWLLQIKSDSIVPLWNPQLSEGGYMGHVSNVDLSLSSNCGVNQVGAGSEGGAETLPSINLETTHTTQRERERNHLWKKATEERLRNEC